MQCADNPSRPGVGRCTLVCGWAALAIGLAGLPRWAIADDAGDTLLPQLASLPVTIIPKTLVQAGGGATFEVSVYQRAGGAGRWWVVDGDYLNADLASLVTDVAYPRTSAFAVDVVNRERSPATRLRMVLEATSTPCLVSGIDNRLVHTFSSGREIRVSTVYYKDTTRLARAGAVRTLCTSTSGQLAIYFGSPVYDMLNTTVITYDDSGSKAAVSQMNFDFPTYAW